MTDAARSYADASYADTRPRTLPAWSPGNLAGRLVELNGRARLTLAIGLVLAAQQKREPAAWITTGDAGFFFPPDAAASGVDLDALPFVAVEDVAAAARAADLLLRSGAFGLVVLDLGDVHEMSMPAQSRLVALAQKHEAAVVCVTEGSHGRSSPDVSSDASSSLSSLVSLRADAWRKRATGSRFLCGVRAAKDKQRGPGWTHEESFRGPPGT